MKLVDTCKRFNSRYSFPLGTHLPLMPGVLSNYSIAYSLLQVNTVVYFVLLFFLTSYFIKIIQLRTPYYR
jgi:hypothetical protein